MAEYYEHGGDLHGVCAHVKLANRKFFGGSESWGTKVIKDFSSLKEELIDGECALKVQYLHCYCQPIKQFHRNSVVIQSTNHPKKTV